MTTAPSIVVTGAREPAWSSQGITVASVRSSLAVANAVDAMMPLRCFPVVGVVASCWLVGRKQPCTRFRCFIAQRDYPAALYFRGGTYEPPGVGKGRGRAPRRKRLLSWEAKGSLYCSTMVPELARIEVFL